MDARSLFFHLVLIFTVLTCRAESQAQESGATWWNPTTWGASSGERKSTFFNSTSSTKEKSGFSLPQMPWSSTEKATSQAARPAPAGPSMLSKMGQSTKQAWNKTVDFLNPFDSEPAKKPQQQGYQPQNQTKTTTAGSGMFGWMWREERTETPGSVNEFLRQERPRF